MTTSKARRRRRRRPPAAARVGDHHVCRYSTEGMRHRGGEILEPAARTVLIGEMPAARVGDFCWCDGDAFDVIVEGEPTVLIGGRPAVRAGDRTDGGYVAEGADSVQIGRSR